MTSQVDRSIETSCVGKLHRKERTYLCTKVYDVERSPKKAPRKSLTKNDTTSRIDRAIYISCVGKLQKKEIICMYTKIYIQNRNQESRKCRESFYTEMKGQDYLNTFANLQICLQKKLTFHQGS